jgi:predicted Zn-dependent protease
MVGRGQERASADAALVALREALATRLPDLLQGWAHAQIGAEDARELLEGSLENLSPEEPNPLEYRAHVELARLDFEAGQLEPARLHLRASLEQNGGYVPAHGLLGRIHLAAGNPTAAVAALQRVVEEQIADAVLELAYAEALVSLPNVSDSDRERARKAVKRAAEKGAAGDDFARVAWVVDAAMAEEMGIPSPESAGKKKRGRRRGR